MKVGEWRIYAEWDNRNSIRSNFPRLVLSFFAQTSSSGIKIGMIGHLNKWVGFSDFNEALIRGIVDDEDVSMRNFGYKYIGRVGDCNRGNLYSITTLGCRIIEHSHQCTLGPEGDIIGCRFGEIGSHFRGNAGSSRYDEYAYTKELLTRFTIKGYTSTGNNDFGGSEILVNLEGLV